MGDGGGLRKAVSFDETRARQLFEALLHLGKQWSRSADAQTDARQVVVPHSGMVIERMVHRRYIARWRHHPGKAAQSPHGRSRFGQVLGSREWAAIVSPARPTDLFSTDTAAASARAGSPGLWSESPASAGCWSWRLGSGDK